MDIRPTDDTLTAPPEREQTVFYTLLHVTGALGVPGPSLDAARAATVRWLTIERIQRPALCQGVPLDTAVERALAFYETGRELRVGARSEAGAFAAFVGLSRLRGHDALNRWRIGFPWGRDGLLDPLHGELSRLARILPGYRP